MWRLSTHSATGKAHRLWEGRGVGDVQTNCADISTDADLGTATVQAESWTGRTKPLEFRGLQYFVSVAQTGNFAVTAREFDVSQTTITRNIRKLEESLGAPLFLRHGRGASLTSVGSRLAQRLESILQLLMSAAEEQANSEEKTGNLSLALSPEVGLLLAPTLLRFRRARWPRTRFEIQEAVRSVVEESVLDHRADLAIVQDATPTEEVLVQPILSETLGLVTAPRHMMGQTSRPVRLPRSGWIALDSP
jgi:DNA-binding transcriptional LysR family regulator